MKKRTFKRVAVIAAACFMITGVTAFAAGKISFFTASSNADYDYKTVAEMNANTSDQTPVFPESLDNGFSFTGGNTVHVEGKDDSGTIGEEWDELRAEYNDRDGNTVAISVSPYHCVEEPRNATEVRSIKGIEVQYNCDEYLVLPDESFDLDEATKDRLENDDHFFVSYGSDNTETFFYQGISFEQNGNSYLLSTDDSIDNETLFHMAAELID